MAACDKCDLAAGADDIMSQGACSLFGRWYLTGLMSSISMTSGDDMSELVLDSPVSSDERSLPREVSDRDMVCVGLRQSAALMALAL